jgi:murein L,D-transpeptidase YcbB/YkuD
VKVFQTKHGLVPDGFIGPQTWHHLNESKTHG